MTTPEPILIAYRVDLKKKQEFYSVEEAKKFFKASRSSIYNKANGYDGAHVIGKNINQRWSLFLASTPIKYVQSIINDNKELKLKYK